MRRTPPPQDDNGAPKIEIVYSSQGLVRTGNAGPSTALASLRSGRDDKASSGAVPQGLKPESWFGACGTAEASALLRHRIRRQCRCHQPNAWVLRWEFSALRRTPPPQDDNGAPEIEIVRSSLRPGLSLGMQVPPLRWLRCGRDDKARDGAKKRHSSHTNRG